MIYSMSRGHPFQTIVAYPFAQAMKSKERGQRARDQIMKDVLSSPANQKKKPIRKKVAENK